MSKTSPTFDDMTLIDQIGQHQLRPGRPSETEGFPMEAEYQVLTNFLIKKYIAPSTGTASAYWATATSTDLMHEILSQVTQIKESVQRIERLLESLVQKTEMEKTEASSMPGMISTRDILKLMPELGIIDPKKEKEAIDDIDPSFLAKFMAEENPC